MAKRPLPPRHYQSTFRLDDPAKAPPATRTVPQVTPGSVPPPDPAQQAKLLGRLEDQKRALPAVVYLEAKCIINGSIKGFSVTPSDAQRAVLKK